MCFTILIAAHFNNQQFLKGEEKKRKKGRKQAISFYLTFNLNHRSNPRSNADFIRVISKLCSRIPMSVVLIGCADTLECRIPRRKYAFVDAVNYPCSIDNGEQHAAEMSTTPRMESANRVYCQRNTQRHRYFLSHEPTKLFFHANVSKYCG